MDCKYDMDNLPTETYLKTDVLEQFEPWHAVYKGWGMVCWGIYDLTETICREIANETGVSPNPYMVCGRIINLTRDPELKHLRLFTLLDSLMHMTQAKDMMHNYVLWKYEEDVKAAHARETTYMYHDYTEFATKSELRQENMVERYYHQHYAYVVKVVRQLIKNNR